MDFGSAFAILVMFPKECDKNISRKLQNSQCFLRNVTVSEPAEGRRNITKGLGNKNTMKMPIFGCKEKHKYAGS